MPQSPNSIHVHLVSDATGETTHQLARAALAQFTNVETIEHVWTLVRTEEHLIGIEDAVKKHGGVVPELASRSHLEKIQIMTNELFSRQNIDPNEINIFSATCGPGLIGSLLVGSTFTKSLAISFQKPFIPINHLEGHILSTSFNNDIKNKVFKN